MQFIKDAANNLSVFLTRFQTNNLMLPLLSDALVEIFTSLMSMVIKQNVLNNATTALALKLVRNWYDRQGKLTRGCVHQIWYSTVGDFECIG